MADTTSWCHRVNRSKNKNSARYEQAIIFLYLRFNADQCKSMLLRDCFQIIGKCTIWLVESYITCILTYKFDHELYYKLKLTAYWIEILKIFKMQFPTYQTAKLLSMRWKFLPMVCRQSESSEITKVHALYHLKCFECIIHI